MQHRVYVREKSVPILRKKMDPCAFAHTQKERGGRNPAVHPIPTDIPTSSGCYQGGLFHLVALQVTLKGEIFKLLEMGPDVIDTYGQFQFYQETAQLTQVCLQHQQLLLAPDRAAEPSAEDAATLGTCQIPVRRQPTIRGTGEAAGLAGETRNTVIATSFPGGKFPEEISESD